ncbi:UDP-glucose dehydrogenase family protein [Cohnella soli]|uniref:UDP-glucose 6-dehydrogenase n=1 Tax=Cohnella soli TaxID=425005 RepID=A0ABW0HVH1_9BACL
MKLAVVGTGYVGLITGVCFAELGHEVVCADKDSGKIEKLRLGEAPIYEPGLQEMLWSNADAGRIAFTTDLAAAVRGSEIVIIAVGTPSTATGEADLSFVERAAESIGEALDGPKTIMTKSTVPVGTNARIEAIVASRAKYPFRVVSVPEFLREGYAIRDTFNPDRIVIGTDRAAEIEAIVELHKPLTDRIFVTDVRSAEMIKYASNAYLATRISFINEIANICEKVGADITQVSAGMGQDRRIGPHFLNAGIGYGGSCFPKDTKALIQIAGNVDYDFKLLKSVVEVNREQRNTMIRKLREYAGSFSGKTFGIWGLAFKPNTDDVREAPALDIVSRLIGEGARVRVYDPAATANFRSLLNDPSIEWCTDPLSAAKGSDGLMLLTEWNEFAEVDLRAVEQTMNTPILIDGRNLFGDKIGAYSRFWYYSVGRPHLNRSFTKGDQPSAFLA